MDIAQLGFQINSRPVASATTELDRMTSAAGRAQTGTERMAAQVQAAARSLGGLAAGVAVLEAVRRGISAGVREAIAFRSAMAEVSTLLNDVSGLNKQSAALRNLSTLYGTTATAQARAYYQAISAGAKEGAQALEVLNTANKLAIGGATQVEVALDGLTSVMNAYAAANLSAADISDTLFIGMRAGKTTIGQLSGALGQVAPIASSVGVEFNELVSAVSAITTAGVSTNIAVTQVRAALTAVLKPTSEASKLAKELGIDFSVAGVRANGFAAFLEEVRQKTGGSEAAIATLFGSVEAIGGMLALTGTQAEKFGDILGQQAARAGETDRAFAKMAESAEFTFARLGSIIADRMMSIGDAIVAGITPAARMLVESIDQIATAIALAFGGRALASIGAYSAEVMKAIAAKSAMLEIERLSAAASERSAAATLLQARAEEQQIASQLQLVRASVATAEASYAQANATTIAAQKQVEAARSAGALSFALRAVRDAEEKLEIATRRRAQAMAALSGLDRAQAGIQAQLAAATNATTAAMTAQTAAAARSAAALTGMQAVMAAVSAGAARAAAALGAVFTALGGWVTVGLAALYGLYRLGEAMVNGSAEAQDNAAALDQLSESMARSRRESELLAAGVAQGSLATASAVQTAIQSMTELQAKTYDSGNAFIEWSRSSASGIGLLADAYYLLNEQTDKASIEKQTEALERFLSELGGSIATADNAEQAIQEAVTALQAAGFNADGLAGRLQWLNSMFGETKTAAQEAAAGMAPFSEETQNLLNRLRERTETVGLAGVALLQYQQTQAVASAEDARSAEAIRAQYDALIQRTAAHEAATKATADATRAQEAAARASQEAAMKAKAYTEQLKQLAAQQRLQRSADGAGFLQSVRQLAATLAGPMSVALLKYNQQMDEATRLQFEGAISTDQAREAMALFGEELKRAGEEIEANSEHARWMQSILDEFNNTSMNGLVREIERVGEALKEALTPDQREAMLAYMNKLQTAAADYRQQGLETMVGATQQVLGSIQKLSKEGSKSYKAMEVASQALNVVLAIGAIVNQGKGDPYTAFARMAAMAAAVAGLVGSIGGSFGGSNGFTDTAEERQRTQGTGTVLGDAAADSQSILNSAKITADATAQLPGLSRGMLEALQSLRGGLDRAGGMLARGAGRAEFEGVGGRFDVGASFMGGIFGSLATRALDPLGILGGSSRVTDQGIAIGGGGLNDLNVQAYQEQQYRRWRFGSRRTQEDTSPIGGEFASQFQLIVDSISETVRQGALALGLLPAEIEAAMAAFRLEEIRISLKDLSAAEQQEELLAVFSSIFDGLAGSVVPFIEQFQRVGEGLGETLVRVATGVQVTQEAVRRLGFALDETDPEKFAQISEGLIAMVGGIDEFIASMKSFVDAFAPEAHKFEVAHSDLTRAFEAAGLVLPETREGMWALMQSLDATTEAGQAQIATLLRLTSTADSYYTMLERRQEETFAAFDAEAALSYADAVAGINRQLANIDGTSSFVLSLRDIAGQYSANVARLNDLARAAGLAGAREEDLARALQLSTMQRVRAIQALEEEARALVRSLGLDPLGMLDTEIAALQAIESQASSAVSSFGDAMGEAARAASDAVNLLLGDLSPLRDSQKLQVAMEALRAGQVGPEDVLRIARRLFASGQDYRNVFDQVMEIGDRRDQGGGNVGGGGSVGGGVSVEMQALLDRRAELEAEANAAQRFMQAGQLAQMIADLAGARGEDFETIAQSLGLTGLDQLLTDLQMDNVGALTDYLTALQADSYTLADLAATVTAGEQLIVDTLRDIFEVQALVDRIAERSELAMADSDQRIEAMEIPERIAESSEPVQEELRQLREQVRELTETLREVAANTGQTASNTGSLTETVQNRDLVDTSNAPRSSRFGRGGDTGAALL